MAHIGHICSLPELLVLVMDVDATSLFSLQIASMLV